MRWRCRRLSQVSLAGSHILPFFISDCFRLVVHISPFAVHHRSWPWSFTPVLLLTFYFTLVLVAVPSNRVVFKFSVHQSFLVSFVTIWPLFRQSQRFPSLSLLQRNPWRNPSLLSLRVDLRHQRIPTASGRLSSLRRRSCPLDFPDSLPRCVLRTHPSRDKELGVSGLRSC